MSLSVGLLHFTGPPVVGGVETVLGHHARLLADAGHRVRVITGRGGTSDPRVERVRLRRADTRDPAILAAQHALDEGIVPPGFEALVGSLADELAAAAEGLDILVAHNVCSLNVNVALTAALARVAGAVPASGPRLVAWSHDIAATSVRYRTRLHPGQPWDLFRRPWPRAIPVAVSEGRRRELAEATGLSPTAIRVIPNGIDRDALLGLRPDTRRLMDALGLHEAGTILLVPARLTPRKNLELAIAILGELRAAGDDARLLVTGPLDPHDPTAGRYLDRLRELARATGVAPAVHLLTDGPAAWRSSLVVADLFRVADALLLPSLDEGFGLTVLEAAACRLPVICADLPVLRELGGMDATYIDPSGDPAAAAAVIRLRLAADPTHRFAIRARRVYRWQQVYARYIWPLLAECRAMAPVGPGAQPEAERTPEPVASRAGTPA